MNFENDIIRKFSCFLVQKVSNYGSLNLYTKTIIFKFSNHNENDISIDYNEITNINSQISFGETITNLEIQTHDKSYNFTGIYDIQALNDFIILLKQIQSEPKITYGFVNQNKNKIIWTNLKNPTLLYSCIIPVSMDKIKEKIMSQSFFNELYSDFGSTNVHLDEWGQKNCYQERTIYYNKLLIIPIFGKKILNLSENQKMFDMKNKIGIFVKSNLGDTPFHECFDPQVQLIFADQGNSIEFLCYLDVVWSKSCAVKSIFHLINNSH